MSAVLKPIWDYKLPELLKVWDEVDRGGTYLPGIRALCLTDRFYLLVKVLKRVDLLHPWLYERCREVERSPDGHLDLWAREHGKSSIITIGGSIQEILKDPDITVGIFSHTRPGAKKFLRAIKEAFEYNEVLKKAFPDVLWDKPQSEAPRWSEEGIVVRRKTNSKEATVEAWGLVDGQPTGAHFRLMIYDDVVTKESVSTPEQIVKTTEAWSISDNLGSVGGRKWYIGTRYCTIGDMNITMSDWSQRPIKDVNVGEYVVGWELRDGKRWLVKSKVLDKGSHSKQEVRKFNFSNGRSVVCTPDHLWWRGPHGSGTEYKPLAMPGHGRRSKGKRARRGMGFIRQLMVPATPRHDRDAGWLAGFFDGEGTTRKNTNHPSGSVCIVQSMANPELIEECRSVLKRLGYKWSESWHDPATKDRPHWHKRCVFIINGGWRERYRFLREICPRKKQYVEATLWGQIQTEKIKLVSEEDAGHQDVYWLETETGNYISEGFCSKNSFADTYETIMKRGAAKPRVYPATKDGLLTGGPVYFPKDEWERRLRDQLESDLACQMLQNPLSGTQRMFNVSDLQTYECRPENLNIYVLIDPARSKKKDSANTAMTVIGVDYALNKYLLDGYNHKMDLQERWQAMRNLYTKWMQEPGVTGVQVGYEKFGAQSDLDYFKERMDNERMSFPILELAWPSDGEGSKVDRVQRLVPDIKNHRFYLPHPTDKERLTSMQRRMADMGYGYRISQQIRRKDENGNLYDLSDQFKTQLGFFPFGGLKDLVDAASRIYDVGLTAPRTREYEVLEPEIL